MSEVLESTEVAAGALGEALRDSCMIVTMSMSMWTPTRTDRLLANDLAVANSGAQAAFIGKKHLLAGADGHFRAIAAAQSAFRKYVYANTLPFGATTARTDRGPRLVANARFIDLMAELGRARKAMEASLAAAKAGYAASIETAKRNLGNAFDMADYPDAADLDELFSIDLEFQPVPEHGGFRGLDPQVVETLGIHVQKRLDRKADAARADVREKVEALAERFGDRVTAVAASLDPAFDGRAPAVYQSLFDSAKDMASLIRAYAPVTGADEALTRAATLLDRLGGMTPDGLRTDSGIKAARKVVDALDDCFA